MSKGAYVSPNGTARKVKEIYVGVNGRARKVVKGYVGINGVARQFWPGGKTISGWRSTTLPATASWSGIAFGNGRFVAVGGAAAAYSSDGISWTRSTLPANCEPWAVAFGNGIFVAPSYSTISFTDRRAVVMYSTNGASWSTAYIEGFAGWRGITYAGGKFVAVGSDGAAYSTDGINWTRANGPSGTCRSIAYGAEKFIVTRPNGLAAYSTDGANWEDINGLSQASGITYGNGLFIATQNSVGTYGMKSTDGLQWQSVSFGYPFSDYVRHAIVFGDGLFVTLATPSNVDPGTRCDYSADGIRWQIVDIPAGVWSALAYGNDRFVAVAGSVNGSSQSNLAAYTI